MSRLSRQQWLMVVLLVVLGYLLWARVLSPLVRGNGAAAATERSVSRLAQIDIVPLRQDLLEPDAAIYKKSRNVFEFYVAPKKKAPPKPKPKPRNEQQQRRREKPRPQKPKAPQPPPVSLQFLGSFGPKDRPIAVLVDGDDLLNVREGDVVSGQFILVNIGYESADIGFVNFPDHEPKRLEITGS